MNLEQVARTSPDRLSFWTTFLQESQASNVVEIGVWQGAFAASILRSCPAIERYYLVDPWRHLASWDKPANRSDDQFESIRNDALERLAFAGDRCIELRGTTREVIDAIPDGSLDVAYIDGDHTLRGITIDLELVAPKIRPGGWIGGDDFVGQIWQHGPDFEPTLVFPYAVYFAEAINATIYAVGHQQFLMHLDGASTCGGFKDFTGTYPRTTLTDAGAASKASSAWSTLRRLVGLVRGRLRGVVQSSA